MRSFLISLCLFVSCASIAQDVAMDLENGLTVEISNIRSERGQIYLFLYNYENQYPKTPYKFFKVNKNDMDSGVLSFQIPQNLELGKYAMTFIDDENANETLDKKFGIPIEGYGFSNNEKPTLFYLPKYDKLIFELPSNGLLLNVKMQYVF